MVTHTAIVSPKGRLLEESSGWNMGERLCPALNRRSWTRSFALPEAWSFRSQPRFWHSKTHRKWRCGWNPCSAFSSPKAHPKGFGGLGDPALLVLKSHVSERNQSVVISAFCFSSFVYFAKTLFLLKKKSRILSAAPFSNNVLKANYFNRPLILS